MRVGGIMIFIMIKRSITIILALVIAILHYSVLGDVVIKSDATLNLSPSKMLVIDTAKYKFTYDVSFVKDTLQGENKTKGRTLLFTGKHRSLYVDYYSVLSDSVYAESIRKGESQITAINKSSSIKGAKFKEVILHDYPKKGNMLVQDYFGGAFRQYIEEFVAQDWKITEEKSDMLGYECRKALCHFRGRDYEAWFAETVPVQYGPAMFKGLPGLIFKLTSVDGQYDFTLIGIETIANPFELELFNGKGIERMSRKDYRFLKQYYAENMGSMFLDNSTIKMKMTPEERKELEKRLNRPRPYNPIEKE